MAKSPRTGDPEIGSGIGASAVRVASSTGVTALEHTTYPIDPVGARDEPRTGAGTGVVKTEHPVSTTATVARTTARDRRLRGADRRVTATRGKAIGGLTLARSTPAPR